MVGSLADVTALLSEGAAAGHASLINKSLMTPLMWAAAEGYVEIARLLLNAGASPNAKNSSGSTALLLAFENLPSLNPRPAPPAGFPSLPGRPAPPQLYAGRRITGHAAIIKLLLANGASMDVRTEYGETVLHLAARKAQTEWVSVCADVGLEVESIGYNEVALHVAAKEGHASVVRALCELGANINARSRYGWTPLIWASACANLDAVKTLLEFEPDVNLQTYGDDMDGTVKRTSALREARRCSKPIEMSKLLIRAGAIE